MSKNEFKIFQHPLTQKYKVVSLPDPFAEMLSLPMFMPVIWQLLRGLWLQAIIALIGVLLFSLGMMSLVNEEYTFTVFLTVGIGLILWIYQGLVANDKYMISLSLKGYKIKGTVFARNKDEALEKYFNIY